MSVEIGIEEKKIVNLALRLCVRGIERMAGAKIRSRDGRRSEKAIRGVTLIYGHVSSTRISQRDPRNLKLASVRMIA